MKNSLLFRCFVLHGCNPLGVVAVVAVAMLLPTDSAIAQDTPEEKNKRDMQVRAGFALSGKGFIRSLNNAWQHSIESPGDDVMPYPIRFLNIRYNKYQAILGWGDDKYGNPSNENIIIFIARYNYYPFKRILYISGGSVIWNFNKKFSFIKSTCNDYGPSECVITDIKTDRPDGKSITLGIITGLGIEYTVSNRVVLLHEVEFYFSPACKYKEFICSGFDVKMLGVHYKF